MEKFLLEGYDAQPQHDLHRCRFGAWLEGEGAARHAPHPAFPEVKRLHEAVHGLVQILGEQKHADNKEEMLAGAKNLRGLSDALLEKLRVLVMEPLH